MWLEANVKRAFIGEAHMSDESSDGLFGRHRWWIGRLVYGLAAVMVLLATIPAAASAALSISAVSLRRTSGPPGSVLIAGINSSGANGLTNSTVTVSRTGTTSLGSIRYS
jgi:hypothetical protein